MCMRHFGYIIGMIISFLIAVIIGIIGGFASFTLIIPRIINGIAIACSLGVLTIVGVIFLTLFDKTRRCICKRGVLLSIVAIGLIITTVIAISITIVPAVIPIAILIGLIIFFLTFILLEVLQLAICLVKTACFYKREE
ncbi:MAG: hypothetical protein Q4G05_05475 [Clostridia bacterium]|nr:hypothetical protein [Clostridia bacterium]